MLVLLSLALNIFISNYYFLETLNISNTSIKRKLLRKCLFFFHPCKKWKLKILLSRVIIYWSVDRSPKKTQIPLKSYSMSNEILQAKKKKKMFYSCLFFCKSLFLVEALQKEKKETVKVFCSGKRISLEFEKRSVSHCHESMEFHYIICVSLDCVSRFQQKFQVFSPFLCIFHRIEVIGS